MTERNTDLFFAVADQIEAHPGAYDQETYGERFDCGTRACIAGWAVLLNQNPAWEVWWKTYDYGGGLEYELSVRRASTATEIHVHEAAQEMLGLTAGEASRLFAGGWMPPAGSFSEPNDVAEALRHIGKGGPVDEWTHQHSAPAWPR